MIPVLNIIHLDKENFPSGSDLHLESMRREHRIKAQAFEHGLKFGTYAIWEGILDKQLPWRGISQIHKRIVQYAKDKGLPFIVIAEDDFKLAPGGWEAFMKDAEAFTDDILLGGISGGNVNEETKEVTAWSGMFLYCVNHRFYDAFLAADETLNIDRWLSTTGLEAIEKLLGRKPVYKVCWPMAAITFDGVSFKSGEYVDHSPYFLPYQVQK